MAVHHLLFTVLLCMWCVTGNPASNNDCPLSIRETYLLEWFCMSQDSTGLVVGACPYHHYSYISTQRENFQEHYLLPKHISDLEDFMCGHLNRKGRMCGQCRFGLLSGCGNLCNTASLVVVSEGSGTSNRLSLKPLLVLYCCLLAEHII